MLFSYSQSVPLIMKDKAFNVVFGLVSLLALAVVVWDTKEVNRQYAETHPSASPQPVVTAEKSSGALSFTIGAVEFEVRIK